MTHERVPLSTHVASFKKVRDQIASEFGLDEDDQTLLDTVEGETELVEYLHRLMRHALDAQAQAAGLADLIKQRQDRKSRLQAKHDRLKSIVLHAMADAGLPKLTAPDFSATRSRSQPAVIITADVSAIPDSMCRITREADKKAIGARLKAGVHLDYATLGNPVESLTVRAS